MLLKMDLEDFVYYENFEELCQMSELELYNLPYNIDYEDQEFKDKLFEADERFKKYTDELLNKYIYNLIENEFCMYIREFVKEYFIEDFLIWLEGVGIEEGYIGNGEYFVNNYGLYKFENNKFKKIVSNCYTDEIEKYVKREEINLVYLKAKKIKVSKNKNTLSNINIESNRKVNSVSPREYESLLKERYRKMIGYELNTLIDGQFEIIEIDELEGWVSNINFDYFINNFVKCEKNAS